MSLKTLLFGEPAKTPEPQPDLTEEVEGLLLALGRSIKKSQATIEGSLRTLDFFAGENRKATLIAIGTLVLRNPNASTFVMYELIRSGREPEWPSFIAKGTAVACIFLNATELVGILSMALTIHPEESEELALALNWVLIPREKRCEMENPFRCLVT
ncbi:MAG: hypothetical protein Q8P01_00150 [bacterium]|nr:hypothetical protein [bacterium]